MSKTVAAARVAEKEKRRIRPPKPPNRSAWKVIGLLVGVAILYWVDIGFLTGFVAYSFVLVWAILDVQHAEAHGDKVIRWPGVLGRVLWFVALPFTYVPWNIRRFLEELRQIETEHGSRMAWLAIVSTTVFMILLLLFSRQIRLLIGWLGL